jgi:hypothetical protein
MPTMKLTDRTIKSLPIPATDRIDYFDSVLPSFGVRVSHTGRKAFFVMYRTGDQQRRD